MRYGFKYFIVSSDGNTVNYANSRRHAFILANQYARANHRSVYIFNASLVACGFIRYTYNEFGPGYDGSFFTADAINPKRGILKMYPF